MSHSALWKLLVLHMVLGSFLLVRIRSSWCQCLDLGWHQETVCWVFFFFDGQLVEAAQLGEPLTVPVHLANTMVSEGGRPCVVVNAHPCIEVPNDVKSFVAGHTFDFPVKSIIEAVLLGPCMLRATDLRYQLSTN